ncbi:SDR family oxidoreductase [Christensenellaceae bacterium OttesenSCG-928-M15]|nr:SDR family oxidoreductase [Christensenellaceae bacterium OttesenSCG-928-M15]
MNTLDLFSLKGKVALITGGRAMYGKSCSIALHDAGARLYIASTNLEAAEEFAAELCANGGYAKALSFHQEDEQSIRELVQTLVRLEGRIDVFVNASRVIPKGGVGWFQEEAGLDWSVRVNSAGMLYLSGLVGEQMIKQKNGSMIHFGSMMGLIGVEKHNYDGEGNMGDGAHAHDYALNKSAITAFTRHAASYYGAYGVRVNALCPGGLASERTPPRFRENYSRHTQLLRLANQDDIKGPLLFLASDASAYLTGLSLPVDGGYTSI